jgi:hypothetical protein
VPALRHRAADPAGRSGAGLLALAATGFVVVNNFVPGVIGP